MSANILETTGKDVTATPTAEMMITEIRLPFGPAKAGRISQGPSANPRTKGIPVPTIVSHPTSRLSSRLNNCCVSAPDRNISPVIVINASVIVGFDADKTDQALQG